MSLLKFFVLFLAMTLGSGKKSAGGSAVPVEELRELLQSSMQTTISLTELVEQQTQRISEITTFVDEAREEAKKTREDIQANKLANEAAMTRLVEEIQVMKLENEAAINSTVQKIQVQIKFEKEKALNSTEQKFLAMKFENEAAMNNTAQKILAMKFENEEAMNNTKVELKNKTDALAGNLVVAEEKLVNEIEGLKLRAKDVVIVSSEEELREQSCARVCAGTTKRGDTAWYDWSPYGVYTYVDISQCGFVTIPTVTTSLEAGSNHYDSTGVTSVYDLSTSGFYVYVLDSYIQTGSLANSHQWTVDWVAAGFTC